MPPCVTFCRDGFTARFRASDVPSQGRASKGVHAIKLREGDAIVDMDILSEEQTASAGAGGDNKVYALLVTEKGFGKRIDIEDFHVKGRRGKGVTAIKFKKVSALHMTYICAHYAVVLVYALMCLCNCRARRRLTRSAVCVCAGSRTRWC